MHRNCSVSKTLENGFNSVERDKKLFIPGESHNSSPTKFELNPISGNVRKVKKKGDYWTDERTQGHVYVPLQLMVGGRQ